MASSLLSRLFRWALRRPAWNRIRRIARKEATAALARAGGYHCHRPSEWHHLTIAVLQLNVSDVDVLVAMHALSCLYRARFGHELAHLCRT